MIVLQKKANMLLESYVREIYSDKLYTLIHKLNKVNLETLENDLRKVADKVIILILILIKIIGKANVMQMVVDCCDINWR